jgi:host factor-I protein
MMQEVISEEVISAGIIESQQSAESEDHNHDNGGTNGSANAAEVVKPRPASKSGGHSPTALQDMFLNGLRRENIDVVIYFCDGSQERGAVRAFDTFTILLENRQSGKAQLIYKHAVARIFPVRTPSLRLDRPADKS